MADIDFNKQKLITYWEVSSDDDYDTMMAMFDCKKFNWSLFIGHLMIEKLLKALYVKRKNEYPPYIHNLLRLAEKCDLELTNDQTLFLVTVTAFNINARYDDFKMSFHKKCTLDFTQKWIEEFKIHRQWIKGLLS
jgi:HEPN domain-containing protein